MMKFFLTLVAFSFIHSRDFAQRINIIPEPVEIIQKNGDFSFTSNTPIIFSQPDTSALHVIQRFSDEFFLQTNISLKINQPVIDNGAAVSINMQQDERIKTKDGYILDIDDHNIKIIANSPAGLFYSFVSLKQLLPVEFYASKKNTRNISWKVPCGTIIDYPQFPYRGMNLDVSRHFFPSTFIKKYIDILAAYKFNIFHWHLTDSHGWRIEIKQYPKLTSVGAWRADRKNIPMTIAPPTQKNEPATYGGYYTQREIKEIIRYAAEKFITIIPEIEMPGHCTAALVAYPQFNCLNNKAPLLIPCGYPGDLEHNFCVGYDSTYIFLDNILKEVISVFPSPYIHIGGDEVRAGPWLSCPRCTQRMKALGLSNTKELQAYFTHRIDSFISANGRRTIGWEEILLANPSAGATGMAWHGYEGAIENVKKGYDVVLAPYHYTYFDFYQSDPGLEDNIVYAGLTLDTVYAFNTKINGLTGAEEDHIIGAEGSLWTENVETASRVEYMLLPRLLALSESVWAVPNKKNYPRFISKTEIEMKRLNEQHINFARSMYNVSIAPSFDAVEKKIKVKLNNQLADMYPVYYTINGKIPDKNAVQYLQPISISGSMRLKTAVIGKNGMLGKMNTDSFTVHLATGKPVSVSPADDGQASHNYTNIVDGIYGTIEPYDGRWFLFTDSIKTIDIDLLNTKNISFVSMRFMEDQVSDIYLPKKVEVSISTDNKKFEPVYTILNPKIPAEQLRHIVNYDKKFPGKKARYIRIIITNANIFPADRQKNILLLDEVVAQ